jgi:hypothetical protein
MSMPAGRRAGIAVLLGLLAIVLLLTVLPGDPGAIRLAGVGALWWLALAAVPLASTLLACVLLLRPAGAGPAGRGLVAVAGWVAPVVVVAVAARVFAGAADAPVIALAALVAPLVALLAAPDVTEPAPNRVASLATLAAAGLALWGSLGALADVVLPLGVRRWQTVVLAAALALLASEWRPRGAEARATPATVLVLAGAAGLVLPVVVVGVAVGASPWSAWSRAASRPAFTFDERSLWVREGRRLAEPATFAFTEAHRVTALAPGAYRIVEQTGPTRLTREWRLAAGDALSLRPGDRLVLEAGAHVRFEAGKRVPGAPPSGAVWADPPERRSARTAVAALGAALTLVGGALVFAAAPGLPPGRAAPAAPALLPALVLAAAAWGVYAALAAPELALGARARAGLFELPALVLPGAGGRALTLLAALALLALAVAGACALRELVGFTAAGRSGRGASFVWAALVLAAAAASAWAGDAWGAFLAGCGLAAAAAAAPRLAGGGARPELAGSLVGATAFLGLWAGAAWLPAWAAAAGRYPALVAAPLAFITCRAWRVAGARRG